MTQIPAPPTVSGFTPEQMQAMISFFFQHQPGAQVPGVSPGQGSPAVDGPNAQRASSSTTAASTDPIPKAVDSAVDVQPEDGAAKCPPTPLKTPPRRKAAAVPPTTPRAPGNTTSKVDAVPASAGSTPASKMAQLTLEGRKLPYTPTPGRMRRSGVATVSAPKGPLPDGYDPQLFYEDIPVDYTMEGDESASAPVAPRKDDDGDESDPYEGFPAIVTAPPATAMDTSTADDAVPDGSKRARSRRKRSEPTTARWMSTRRTRTCSDSSPPAVQSSPKKKARVTSPTLSPQPSPTYDGKGNPKDSMGSPFESPSNVNAADVEALERLLHSIRSGAKIPALSKMLKKTEAAQYVDLEARCSDEEDGDEEDEAGNLKGFVVDDDVVQYDDAVPALPDDEDVRSRRLHRRRSAVDVDDEGSSEVEIVPTPSKTQDKGKGRADPPSRSPSPPSVPGPSGTHGDDGSDGGDGDPFASDVGDEETTTVDTVYPWHRPDNNLANAPGGLYPGSSRIDARAPVCTPLTITPTSSIFAWVPFKAARLEDIGYYVNTHPVLGDCALVLSDFQESGWGTPSFDVVAAAETHVHVRNLIRAMQFRRRGPFINEAQVNPDDLIAVDVSPPSGTKRYKLAIRDTRAPAVSLTTGVVRYFRLDNPSAGPHPVHYLNITPFEGNFDRAVGLECQLFGQTELYCMAFNNAIRMTTLPAFEGPSDGNSKAKPSSSIRRAKNSGQSSRRGSNFELTTNDVVPILDARTVPLPADMSTWLSVLPRYEGVPPRDAVAVVAHTTNMWVGTRTTPTSYNLQYNLLFVVIVGVLPVGFV